MSRHWHNGMLFCCGTLFTALTLLIPSLPFAAGDSRPFWTEKTAFVEGDDLFVVGVASKASTAEAGRQQAFEHGKIELMNYAQVTSLEAQGLVIETQMTYEEPHPDGTVTVYRLLRVPAAKLVAIQGRLETESRAQEQALEKARSELLTIQQSLSEKAQRLRQTEAQLLAQEQEFETIAKRAHARIRQEQEAFQKRCKHLEIGMTKQEVTGVMGRPTRVVPQASVFSVCTSSSECWQYEGITYGVYLEFWSGRNLTGVKHRTPSGNRDIGCP